jgi:hypothetical protein
MDCKKCQNLLGQYLDEELNGPELSDLEQHIKNCPDCLRELERLRKMHSFLTDLKEVEVPEGEREAFIGALRNRIEAEGAKVSRKKSVLRPVLVTAILVVIALIVVVIYPQKPVDIKIAPAPGLNAIENMAVDGVICRALDDHFLATSADFMVDTDVTGGQALSVWKILKETHADLFEPAE